MPKGRPEVRMERETGALVCISGRRPCLSTYINPISIRNMESGRGKNTLPRMPLNLRSMANTTQEIRTPMHIKHNPPTVTAPLHSLFVIAPFFHPLRSHHTPWPSPPPPFLAHPPQVLWTEVIADVTCSFRVETFRDLDFGDDCGWGMRDPRRG